MWTIISVTKVMAIFNSIHFKERVHDPEGWCVDPRVLQSAFPSVLGQYTECQIHCANDVWMEWYKEKKVLLCV